MNSSLTILLIVFPIIAYSAFSTNRHVNVVLENLTGQSYNFQVLHKRKNGTVDNSGWRTFAPRERKEIFSKVQYKTGLMVVGSDNWKVVGKSMKPMSLRKTMKLIMGKSVRNPEYSTFWNKHTLRAKDHKKTILIRVLPNAVEYYSPGRKSSTNFIKLKKFMKRLM